MEPVDERFIKKLIRPGDILLFDRDGFFGRLIKFKRGERYTHIEVALSENETVASRDGQGVARYPIELRGVAAVYRTRKALDLDAGMKWFATVNGQGYDWLGLLAFGWAKFRGRNNNKMFCSEFVVRFIRNCGVELFNPDMDADALSPEGVTYSEDVFSIWLRSDKRKKAA